MTRKLPGNPSALLYPDKVPTNEQRMMMLRAQQDNRPENLRRLFERMKQGEVKTTKSWLQQRSK